MEIDILIKNGIILTNDNKDTIIENGCIAIKGNRLEYVGIPKKELKARKVIDASNCLVMPGFVNIHTHTGNTIYRGFADDLPLKTWLEDYIFPVEKKFCNAETVRLSTLLTCIEMIKSGTTTFSDMYYFEDEVAKVVDKVGMRAELGETLLDFPSPTVKNPVQGLEYTEEFINNWKKHPRISPCITPHAPYTCSDDILIKAKMLTDKYDVPFHTHVSETIFEVEQSKKRHNQTPIEHLNDLGLWRKGDFAIHCVHLSENDKSILKKKGIGVAHNPRSNMKIASGAAPIQDLLNKGITVGLGTDGTASNNNLNMIKEMDSAAMLSKIITMDATSLNAKTLIRMATIDGAKMLRMENKIGSLEKYKQADVIIININKPHLKPIYNYHSHIVYCMNGSEIETVLVNGKILMENRELKTIDEPKVMYEVDKLQKKIKKEFAK